MHAPEIVDIASAARIAAKQLEEAGITQSRCAKELGIAQSQVSRLLAGRSKRATKAFRDVCGYAFQVSQKESGNKATVPQEIVQAVNIVWNGTQSHAEALAIVIRTLAVLDTNRGRRSAPEARDHRTKGAE